MTKKRSTKKSGDPSSGVSSGSTDKAHRSAGLREAGSTATLLMEVAERLFAERGVEAVTLQSILEESGQKNRSALHYYFGSRSDLVTQLLQMRLACTNALRNQYLDVLERDGRSRNVREILYATTRPLVDVVRHESWGAHYIRVLAQANLSPALRAPGDVAPDVQTAIVRTRQLLVEALPELPEHIVETRFAMVVDTTIYRFAHLVHEHGAKALTEDVVGQLVDFTAGAMTGPVTSLEDI